MHIRHILGNLFLPFSRTHHFPNFPPATSDWFTKVHGGHLFAPRKASRSLTEGRLSRPTRATVGCFCLCFQSMSSYILKRHYDLPNFWIWIASQLKSKLLKTAPLLLCSFGTGESTWPGPVVNLRPAFATTWSHPSLSKSKASNLPRSTVALADGSDILHKLI